MKKVLYTKYNSLRKPEFQIKTSIVELEGERYVLKEAISASSMTQIECMKNNYDILKDVYNNIKVIPFYEEEKGIRFEFIKGRSLLDDIDFLHDDIDTIVGKIKEALKKILDINESYIGDFSMSEGFAHLFSDCKPIDKKAFKVANIDSIFTNFIETDGQVWCIDYEWVFNFDIPVNFIIYRNLLYLYTENVEILKEKVDLEGFFLKFGFESDELELYHKMEECFQQYVHGKNRRYIYTSNYVKKSVDFNTICTNNEHLSQEVVLKNQHISNLEKIITNREENMANLEAVISNRDEHIGNLEEIISNKDQHIKNLENAVVGQADFIKKIKKAIKNPFYGLFLVIRRIYRKLMFKFGPESWREKQRVGKYRYKYRNLIKAKELDYETWITSKESEEQYNEKFKYNPKISVVVPVYNVLDKHLVPCIESVINQIYDNWELCLSDDNSTWENVKKTLKKYESNDKIKIVYRKENGHISRATNSALEIATGEFIAFMDCDDVLRPNALYEVVKKLNEDKELDFIYSDEDKIDDEGKHRYMPHFKPDWSPDTFMSHMYTSHLGVYRKSLVDEVGGLRPGFEGAQDYDFTLRFTEKTDRIAHIPKVLYHWRVREESTAGSSEAKPYILEAAYKSKEDALKRRNLEGDLELVDIMYQYRVNYKVKGNPLVTIIIPSKDNYKMLEKCIDSLTSITEYKNYEIVLVDNGSDDTNKKLYAELSRKHKIGYIYEKMDFNFSKMCNLGAKKAKGEYYLFLNDDIEIINPEWLTRMLGHAELKTTGAVGAKLLYPGGEKIQHIGVINIKNGPTHAFGGYEDKNIYYFGRNIIDYNYIAVTAACLLMSADKFKEIGGFNENLAVAYNDVDLCFKLIEKGYYNVVRNDVVLIHHESVSRGNDLEDYSKTQRLVEERKKLYCMHPGLEIDPFYNINLAQDESDFSCAFEKKNAANNKVKRKMIKNKGEDIIYGNVDVARVISSVYIEGWAYLKDYKENNGIRHKVILYNDDNSYMISTDKVYRPDVAGSYPNIENIEFTGFKCEVPRESIAKGTYNIDILCKKRRLETNKTIEV